MNSPRGSQQKHVASAPSSKLHPYLKKAKKAGLNVVFSECGDLFAIFHRSDKPFSQAMRNAQWDLICAALAVADAERSDALQELSERLPDEDRQLVRGAIADLSRLQGLWKAAQETEKLQAQLPRAGHRGRRRSKDLDGAVSQYVAWRQALVHKNREKPGAPFSPSRKPYELLKLAAAAHDVTPLSLYKRLMHDKKQGKISVPIGRNPALPSSRDR
jgi:hypothetical protein